MIRLTIIIACVLAGWLRLASVEAVEAADADQRFLAPYVFIASGSGVIVSSDGDILTNFHVVAEVCSPLAPELTVRLPGVGEVAALLVAADPVGDVALIHLSGAHPPLTAAALVERIPPPGTPVVAVGNPFALGDLDDRPSVSRGVLGTGRVVRGAYADCLQHDAPVNPGNSGGPLFDLEGRLLGINGAIRSRSGFRINSGIGLALSASHLAEMLPALRAAGAEHGGWLVRSMAPPELVIEQRAEGVTVVSGPARLLPGDLILAVAERRSPAVETVLGLFRCAPWTVGHTLPVRVSRQGRMLTVAVATSRAPIPGLPWHGLAVSERNQQLVLDPVESLSPLGRAGGLSGDVLLSVNGAVIGNRLDLLRATAALAIGEPVDVVVRNPLGEERRLHFFVAQSPP